MRKAKRYVLGFLVLGALALGGCTWLLRPLVAELSANPTSGPAPLSVTFSFAGSTGPIVSYTLDFGDGSAPYSGTDLTISVNHTYENPGTYTAILTVQDAAGRTATDSVVITVLEGTTASLSASPSNPNAGETVTFILQAQAAPGRSLASWELDYGDGQSESGLVSGPTLDITKTHSYAAPGTYEATLTVADNEGYTATSSVEIEVTSPKPSISEFKASGDGGATWVSYTDPDPTLTVPAGTTVTFAFDAQAGAGAKLAKWTLIFGDGAFTGEEGLDVTTLSKTGITHDYVQTGSYTATLRVWDNFDQMSEATLTVEVQ